MSKTIRRGVLSALAAAALALTLAPSASAEVIDVDPNFIVQPSVGPSVYRIAGADRIDTAIKASQSRTDWGVNVVTDKVWSCPGVNGYPNGQPAPLVAVGTTEAIPRLVWGPNGPQSQIVTCTVVAAEFHGRLDIFLARTDDYADALAATPFADTVDAPVLLNPTAALNTDVAAEIARLAASYPGATVAVHLLGGESALSQAVFDGVDAIGDVDEVDRHSGIDRYQTAASLATTSIAMRLLNNAHFGDAWTNTVTTYLTTGLDFPDALAAGAAAAEDDGIVLLTAGEKMDARGFTDDYITMLNGWALDTALNLDTETVAVGGPSAKAAADFDINLKAKYVGLDRYETATLTATAVFGDPQNFAVVSGQSYADAVVASAYIANADGPLLLSHPNQLTAVTKAYLSSGKVDAGDRVFTFGGTDTLTRAVTLQIAELFVF